MKIKYLNQLKRLLIICLSFLLSIGSFFGLFAVNASAYDTVSGGQLRLQSGVCYNGADPNHPFRYTTEKIGINNNTWLPEYDRGNTGAGGSVPGMTDILMTRIDTGEAWSSVPLYRVSRSGGYSDNLPYVTGDTTDIVSAWKIQNSVNSLAGINRTISSNEAEMIQTVLKNGFKAGYETTGAGNSYSWSDNLRFVATKILVWEIQEGKRTGFGYEDYAEPGTNNMVGGYGSWGVRYWKGYWDQMVWPQSYQGCANWYYQILDMCRATGTSINVVGGNTGTTVTATDWQATAGRLNATYLSNANCYQLSMYLPDSSLWGNLAGQYNADSFQWVPDSGSGNANLSSSENVVYLTSSNDKPISGYVKITQKQDSYNDVGYMSGGSTNSWRGFLFGGNREPLVLYLRVESVGDQRVKVNFVDSVTGSPVNVNWTFDASGIGTEFTENSSGKNFVPQYWTNSGGANANYGIFVNSVPGDYYMPLNNWTGFNFLNSVIKFGEGGTGWGECDYEKSGASFDGNNITIRLMRKVPVNIKFVDSSTGNPVNVNWSLVTLNTGQAEFTENSSGKSVVPKYFEDNRAQSNYNIKINSIPPEYEMPILDTTIFFYNNNVLKHGTGGTGWGEGNYDKSQASFNGTTITISLRQLHNVEVEFVDSVTGKQVNVDWKNEPYIAKTPVDTFTSGKVTFVPGYWSKSHKSSGYTIKILDSKGYFLPKADTVYIFDGVTVKETMLCNYTDAQAEISGNKVIIKLIKKHSPITINFVDKQDGVTPVDVTGIVTEQSADGKGSYSRNFSGSSYNYNPSNIGGNIIALSGVDTNHIFKPNIGDMQVYAFNYDGDLPDYNDSNPLKDDVIIEGDTVTVLIERKNDVFYDTLPIRIAYRDKKTGKPVNVDWEFSSSFTDYLNGNGGRADISTNPEAFYNIGEKDYSMYFNLRSYSPEGYEEIDDVDLFYTGLSLYDSDGNEGGYFNFNENIRFSKNTITISVVPKEVNDSVQVEFIKPNSDYHYGEEVFSSFYVKNLGEKNYNPTDGTLDLEMKIEKFNGSEWGTFYSESQSGVIVPGNGTQLAYFRWTVPTLPLFTGNEKYRIVSTVSYGGVAINTSTSDINIASFVSSATPPTKFDLDGGKYFVLTNPLVKNQEYHNSASWQQYEWIDGKYVVKTYSNKLWTESITISPDETNPSATFNTGTKLFTTRSGYAIKLALKPKIEQFEVSGTTLTPVVKETQTTAVQRANAYFSENGFTNALEKYDTLELVGENTFGFMIFEKSTYQVGEKGDGRKHFIPMWFPDKEYVVQCVSSSCWSPAGMLSYTDESNKIMINGSLYDDWYSSGNGR